MKHLMIDGHLDAHRTHGEASETQTTDRLDSGDDPHKIGPILRARGYNDTDIAGFYHGNCLGFLRRVPPK